MIPDASAARREIDMDRAVHVTLEGDPSGPYIGLLYVREDVVTIAIPFGAVALAVAVADQMYAAGASLRPASLEEEPDA